VGHAEEPLTEASFRAPGASRLSPPSPRSAPEPTPPQAVETAQAEGEAEQQGGSRPQEGKQQEPVSHTAFTATLQQHARPAAPQRGWRGRIHRWTRGRVSPAVPPSEQALSAALRAVQMTFGGPRTITFVNPKGGAFKTTATLMAGRTFGVHRGGGVVAIDSNETRGTLGERALPAGHHNTARELLARLSLVEDPANRLGDLSQFVRGQGPAHFDVLASDDRAELTGAIDAQGFERLHELFRRRYQLILVDTGNNVRASNWLSAVRQADLVVVPTTVREDTASAALWMADVLERHVLGADALKQRSVALVCDPAPSPRRDDRLRSLLMETFAQRCHTAMPIPYEPALAGGGLVDHTRLSPATHTAWLYACAAMASALSATREGEEPHASR
jgi:MinD-like ATPase involved in chromosome partitioning or flagellar assembly